MGVFAALAIAGMFAAFWTLPQLVPAQLEASMAVVLSLGLVGGIAGTIASGISWRPAQWAALGTGALIGAGVVAYLSFPDLRSLVDPVMPPWVRWAWLVVGYCLLFFGPRLVGEFLKPREAEERGLWHPSRWSFDGVSSVMGTVLLGLVYYSLIVPDAFLNPTWFLAAAMGAVAIMIVAPLIWPVVSRRLWDPRQWSAHGVGLAIVVVSGITIVISGKDDVIVLVGFFALFLVGMVATLYGSNLRHLAQWLAVGAGAVALAGALYLAGGALALLPPDTANVAVLLLLGLAVILIVPRHIGRVLESRRKAREELRALRDGADIQPSSPKVHLVMAYMRETGADLIEAVAALEPRLGRLRDDPQLASFLRVAEALRDKGQRGRHARLNRRSWYPRHWSTYGVGLLLVAASVLVVGVSGKAQGGEHVTVLLFLVGVILFFAGVITTLFRSARHPAQWLAAGAGAAAMGGGLYLAANNPSEAYRGLAALLFFAGILTILFVPKRIGSHLARRRAREEARALRDGVTITPSSPRLDLIRGYMDVTGASMPEAVAALEQRLGPMRDDPQLVPVLDAVRRRREWTERASPLAGGESRPAPSS